MNKQYIVYEQDQWSKAKKIKSFKTKKKARKHIRKITKDNVFDYYMSYFIVKEKS